MLSRKLKTLVCTALLGLSSAVSAADWPSQAITLVVPYTPGTGIDLVARQLSAHLPDALGQPVIVENLTGASGNIGTAKVVRAKPDGYTFLVQVNTYVMNRTLFDNLPYNPVTDLDAVAQTSYGELLLVARPDLENVASIDDMVKLTAAEPGKYTYASPGVGTPHHMSMALLLQNTKSELLHVPYKGTAGALTDLLGGRIDFMFLPVHVALQHIQQGKLKVLATGSANRMPQLPDVPTLAELGIVSESIDMWYGVLAPKGTPDAIIQRMNKEIAKVLERDDVAKAFGAQGMTIKSSSPQEFAKLIQADDIRWSEVIKKGGITAQ